MSISGKHDNMTSVITAFSVFARPWYLWLEVIVASGLILNMEFKNIQFMINNNWSAEIILRACFPLLIAGLAVIIYFSLRRLFMEINEGSLILRIVVSQGLLLLNVSLLGMSTMYLLKADACRSSRRCSLAQHLGAADGRLVVEATMRPLPVPHP